MAQHRGRIQSIAVLCVLASVTLYSMYCCLPTTQQYNIKQDLPDLVDQRSFSNENLVQLIKRSNGSVLKTDNTKVNQFDLKDEETWKTISSSTVHLQEDPETPLGQIGGYALAEDYWEQLSSASRNLQNLQCWAGQFGVSVVEPFSVKSLLRTPLSLAQSKRRFSDFVDMANWNEESKKMGSAELVSWEQFLKEAPRDVIAVEFKFARSTNIRETQREIMENPGKYPPNREERLKQGCFSGREWPRRTPAGFKIVRKVCFNFEYGDVLTMKELIDGIYGTLDPHKTTVLFKQWRGLSSFGRISVQESGCSNTGIQEHMPPSPRLIDNAERYISKYLSGRNGYIAIIARLEKSRISLNKRPGVVNYCLDQTLEEWKKLSSKTGLSTTFLSIDMGKYGSNTFKYEATEFENFFKGMYGDQRSVSDWERSFEDVAESKDSGYIALLQKIIVTRATCILFVGGGSFQKHALALYQSRVPAPEWCLEVVKECTKDKNLRLH